MTNLKDNVNKLNELLRHGRISEAFERYYNINVKPPITGKEQRRDMIFLQEIEKLNSAKIMLVAFGGVNDHFSVTEWEINIENNKGEKKIIYRVNVQHWKDDKITDEKIY